MNKLSIALTLTALLGATACSSTRVGSRARTVNDAKTLTANEWVDFADAISDAINASEVIDRYYRLGGAKPVVLGIGDFSASVGRMSQKDFARTKDVMYAALRESLVNSTGGMASINMDVAGTGGRTDSLVQGSDQLRGDPEYDQATVTQAGQAQAYKLVLTGQIVTIESREGRTTGFDYAVNLTLTDASTRGSVFEKQVILPKTFTRGIFGG